MKETYTFSVDYIQVMDENGNIDESLKPDISTNDLHKIYRNMVRARVLDDKMLSLQRQGRIGTFAEVKGEEACQCAAMACLNENDWMVPSFRESAAALSRGAPVKSIILYAAGDERGCAAPGDAPQHDLPVSIPVGSQIVHTAGIAWAMKLQKENNVAVGYFGDGATSEGDFHDGLNFAGRFKAPAIFICQNNHYAISTPTRKQTASQTIAQKAIAYGIHGVRIDGNDALSVFKAVCDAVARAKSGEGPTLIECVTYRLGNHTTSDDAKVYRSDEEVAEWRKKDPIPRLKNYMIKIGIWSEDQDKALYDEAVKEVEQGIADAESIPPPKNEDMFKYLYEKMTPQLSEQLQEAKRFGE